MSIIINFVGDFCPLGRLADSKYLDNRWLGDLAEQLQASDINVVNLECPLTNAHDKIRKSGPHLKADPRSAELLNNAGFIVATLANNHILDYGPRGLIDTIDSLQENQICYVGAGKTIEECSRPLIMSVQDRKIGFVNFTHWEFSTCTSENIGANGMDPLDVYFQVTRARAECDFLFVILHGGIEMYPYPTPGLRRMCGFVSALGVAGIICHHSHVVSGYEIINSVPVYYGLGNFVFDEQPNPHEWRTGAILNLEIAEEGQIRCAVRKFGYDAEGEIKLKELGDQAIEELNGEAINEVWYHYLDDYNSQRNLLNLIGCRGKLARLLNKFFPTRIWKDITHGYLNTLRNEYSRERLISIIERHLKISGGTR